MIDINDLRERHTNSIRNTSTGRALGAALAELEQMREAEESKYQHTSEELKAVCKVLDAMNEMHQDIGHDYGIVDGSLDVFWADSIAGRITWDSIYEGWFYIPTARGEITVRRKKNENYPAKEPS